MTKMIFKPWIGPNFERTGFEGLRVLILGESHYGEPGTEYDNFTSDVVREWAFGKPSAFFSKIAKSMLRLTSQQNLSDDQRAQFWSSVAFYNYVQKLVGDGPRQRPSPDLWEQSKQAFFEALNQLNPDVCVVFGMELWSNLPSPKQNLTTDSYQTYVYTTDNGKKVFAGCVTHPASKLIYAEAHPRIEALIKLAKTG